MADRSDWRGNWSDENGGRGRGDERRHRDHHQWSRGRDEHRAFGDQARQMGERARDAFEPRGGRTEGEDQPWRRDRYGSRFDQDRTNYGSGWDRDQGGYGRGAYGERDQDRYAGGYDFDQERRRRHHSGGYDTAEPGGGGVQGRRGQGDERQAWRPAGGQPYGETELNAQDRGIQEFGVPHDYAYHPQQGHEFDTHYTSWRDEQLRNHDRDYQEWRRHQHRQYDEDYRKFREERREHFGRSFLEWRSQQSGGTSSPGAQGSAGGGGQSQPGGGGQSGAPAGGGLNKVDFNANPGELKAATDGADSRKGHEDRPEGRDPPH